MDRPVVVKCRDEQVVLYGMAEQINANIRPLESFSKIDEPGYHVGLLHASVIDVVSSSGSANEPVISRDEMSRCGLDYLALGHFHNFQQMTCGGTVVCYPGTPEGRKFGEDGPRFVAVVELLPSGVRVDKTPINKRTLSERQLDAACEEMSSQSDLIAWLEKQSSPDALVRLRLVGTSDYLVDPETVLAAVGESFFYLEVIDETSLVGGEQIQHAANEPTVRGMFARKMLAEIERTVKPRDRAVAERALRIGVAEMGLGVEHHVDRKTNS
jgi:DNA repair exonuclease SbcCD nuclease subunit